MCSDQDFWWNWPVNLGVAAGTLLAVAAALFGSWFQNRFFPPVLLLELVSNHGERTVIEGADGAGYPGESAARFYHIRITNKRRRAPANNTLVYMTRIEERIEGSQYREMWSGNVPLGWRHPDIFSGGQIVGPHVDFDLFSVTHGAWSPKLQGMLATTQRPFLTLYPVSRANNLASYFHRDRPLDIRLTLQARSNEVDSKLYTATIKWTGVWSENDEEMATNLSISLT